VLASASLGFVTVFLGIGQVLGPYLAGSLADIYGTLTYSYLMAAGVFFLGGLLSAVLRETGWRTAIGARQVETARPQPLGPAPAGTLLPESRPAGADFPEARLVGLALPEAQPVEIQSPDDRPGEPVTV
jgi:MFS family permease